MQTPTSSLLIDRNHPLRTALVDEMHVRRFPSFGAPMRMTQLVMLTGELQTDQARQHAEALCTRHRVTAPPKGRYFAVELGQLQFIWEHHTEFCTYSFIKAGAFADPFEQPVLGDLPKDWVNAIPGQVLRATQVALLDRTQPEPNLDELAKWFSPAELMSCRVHHGEASIWADFKLHADGMGRLLIHDRSLHSAGDCARLVQRLQELGNYRNMAMLGLPVAHSLTAKLSELETHLTALTQEMAATTTEDTRLLSELSTLAAQLERITAETSYRMSATRAYAQLVNDRLRILDVARIPGYQTLGDFTERRLTPAVRTCESFSRRLEDLAQRASRASSLMQTRIETILERQNTELLQSMNHRTAMQLRLQQTVEGLSVLAISYYSMGILGYMFKPFAHFLPQWDTWELGAAAPFIVLLVWLMLRRVHKRVKESPADVTMQSPR